MPPTSFVTSRAAVSPTRQGVPTRLGRPSIARLAHVLRPSGPAPLAALLVATAVLYLWGLGASGWANSFYAAAAQAGSASWKAFFFAASDAASSITVDKTPFSVWVMALSMRLFGVSSWSLLVPQALMGVASVGLLHATVRRTTGSYGAGLLAGAVLALTPVAVLMFRFDNPDALLVLLLVGAAAATLRAVEHDVRHPVQWLALAGVLVGLGFMTKMLQAFLVLPALGLVYLLAAQTPLGKRVGHLLVAFGAMVLAGGWWVAVVELWPAASRPWIGGSQHNSVLELTLGYNGLGRLNGEETGSVGGGAGGGGGWGTPGLLRLFNSEIGGQVAWLLPAALVLLAAGLWLTRRAPRTDGVRAALVLWGAWLLVTGLVFSFMAGIFHPYYTVALAPAIGALVGTGTTLLWRRRDERGPAVVLGSTVALSATLASTLLHRTPDFLPWLPWLVLVAGLGSAFVLAVPELVGGLLDGSRWRHRLVVGAAGLALASVLAGPAAYAVDTAATPHTGSLPSAGPASAASGPGGGPGFGQRFGGGRGFPGAPPTGQTTGQTTGTSSAGGLLEGSRPSTALTQLLLEDADSYTWVAATVGANSASGYQLATEHSVMPIGGFNGSDPSPTLAQFQQEVADGDIHWFITGGQGGRGGPAGGPGAQGDVSTAITSWVESTFTATTVDGVTLYDLSGGAQ